MRRTRSVFLASVLAGAASPASAREQAPDEGSALPAGVPAPGEGSPPPAEVPAAGSDAAGAPQAPSTELAPEPTTSSSSGPEGQPGTEISAEDEADALAALALGAPETEEGKIDLYGFADFTYKLPLADNSALFPYDSFAVGHLNAYAGSELGDNWRWLSEVRFMYLPHGSVASADAYSGVRPTNTSVTDYTEQLRPVRWGGISIERAWLERTFHPLLSLRLGHFLTPYGIWNVDHGGPVIIPVTRPYVVGEALLPQSQTGIELYGTWTDGGTQLGYHLTLSNGRGPIDTYQDFDHNKAWGARLFARQDVGVGALTLGASAYRGTYTERHAQTSVDASQHLVLLYPHDAQYRELSLAADLKWEWEGLLLQAEAAVNDAVYVPGRRPPDPGQVLYPGPTGLAADSRRYGYYGLVAYRTPFWGIMPYVFAEDYRLGAQGTAVAAVRGGLNIRSTPRVVLKAELNHFWFHKGPAVFFRPGNEIVFQATWSF
jgi:hypothetical protein